MLSLLNISISPNHGEAYTVVEVSGKGWSESGLVAAALAFVIRRKLVRQGR